MNTLRIDLDNRVLWGRLNRPEQLNAFTEEMAEELEQTFAAASRDDAVGAVIVTGSGRAFCAGMDLTAPGNVFGLDEMMRPTLGDIDRGYHDPRIVTGIRDTGGR